ncbi:Eco57I restriction-modification methylase domain-containing protein [Clostridium sp. UBA6640]|uniref:Eco57I restriction-modification methylase domain-containing protein n=1 Tax=Clostridium sp. UBA6640 TaxID=1946370 RepID=UPI0025B8E399|nr:N-6 DNA methylase [Clostridium sp. UBA6640]
MEVLRKKVKELYTLLLNPIDAMFKLIAIEAFKKEFKIQDNKPIGEYYYDSLKTNKEKGIVYTPYPIAKYIIENTITSVDIINNPFIKIIDPACGAGNLLIPCFLHLVNLYKENLKEINMKNKLKLKEEDINNHIIKNNIYGFDIDTIAIQILQIDLFYHSNSNISCNFINEDFLLWKEDNKFDIFIGNPPYVGPKFIDKDYSIVLKEKFKEIYKDKSDLSYCFFKKALDTLNNKGRISFITSRYFLESSSGKELRKTLNENTHIKKIIDFYGIRPFKGVGIDPVIIFMEKHKGSFGEVEVIKPLSDKGRKDDRFYSSLFLNEGEDYNRFYIKQSTLQGERWILRSYEVKNIIKKIENKCSVKLIDICTSHQGIITGCDKAFVVRNEIIEDENLEKELLKPWIKSSFIKQNQVNRQNSFIIYSDLIEDEDKYPNCMKHISPYKEKLSSRRECLRGVRKWYHLQWGRNKEIFDDYKIIFPFKASSNKFSLDFGSYFSADVYALKLKEKSEFTYEFLLFILNSKIYEFYFKTFAKKLGEDLYEYYPNNLMKLLIPPINEISIHCEEELYKYFLLTAKEIELINQSV